MRATNSADSWGWVSRLLHWVMAGLILFQLGLGLYMNHAVGDLIVRFGLIQSHKSWGFVIFALALLRVAWHLGNRASPGPPRGMPRWQVRAASLSHGLLYLLMLALPLSGWATASAAPTQDLLGIENLVFGWFALPDPWVPGIQAVEDTSRFVHVALALLLAVVLAVHVGAALKHHFLDGDEVLSRMTLGR